MSLTKVCSICKETKDISFYYKGRMQCKECFKIKSKYSQLCAHDKVKSRCRECGGGSICEHDKIRSRCRECGGGSICEHDKVRSLCRECGGGSICEHSKERTKCKECGGNSICEHNKERSQCRECGGGSICEHDKIRSKCRECGGSVFCIHGIRKYACVICNPKCGCIECKNVFVAKRSNYYPLCQPCFCNKYPDHEKSTLYKIKERYLRDELRLRFPDEDINMVFDKAVDGGCSKKRPDVLIDLLLYSIIIECDEGQHKNYECENKRKMQLFEDLGERPLIMIRFNPDSYMENKKKIEGCFKPLIKIEDIHKKKFYDINEEEWNRRVDILEEVIREKIREDIPEKEVEEIKLFYDGF